jgi:predicted DNA-binding transcriptional regulator AlpA
MSINPAPGAATNRQRRFHLDRRAADLADRGAEAGSPDDLLSTSDVAEWLGVSTQFLEIGRHAGYGPRFCRLSPRRCRYLRSDVLAWLSERKHAATREYDTGAAGRKRGSRVVAGKVVAPAETRDGAALGTSRFGFVRRVPVHE